MLEAIEKAFNKALDREPVNKPNEVYVTELAGCVRRSWYRRRYGYRMNKDMIVGTAVHSELLDRVADILADSPDIDFDYVMTEKKVEKLLEIDGRDVWLVGRVDLYIVDVEKDIRIFVEFKTSEWVFEEHMEQGNIYAVMLNIDRFHICYMPKSDQIKCREFERTWTERDVVERIEQLLNCTEPPRREGYWCNYCEFKSLCKKVKALV